MSGVNGSERCDHASAVPVESVITREILAAICSGCGVQLPAGFLGCPHLNTIDISSLCEPSGRHICNDCGTTGWYGQARAGEPVDLMEAS